MNDIVFSSAGELAQAIRAGHVSAVEVLEAHLAQIKAHNGALNAIITLDADGARQRAQAADAALSRGEVWGPLHGVPFTLKDSHATANMRTVVGFPPLADYVPQNDSTVTARLKAAGGVLVGKTNVSTLLADIQTNNPVFGQTNNPWNPACTPGGSSGGAAAALASGMTPFEIGSDIGGSIRIPAHFCGVFGLKATENRISQFGHIPDLPGQPRGVRIMQSIGPMARTVEDLALIYPIIAGPDGFDTEVQPVPVDPIQEVSLKSVRLAVAPTFPGFPVAAEIRAAIESLAAQLEPLCTAVEVAPLPEIDYSRPELSHPDTMAMEAFQPDAPTAGTTLADYLEVLHRRDSFIIAWEQFFNTWDVLLCPVSMITAFPHCETETLLQVDNQTVPYWMANAHCKMFNYTGHPAVVLPYIKSADGLPVGVQLVSKRWGESRLLAIAQAVSEVITPFQRPPSY